jgi:predicted AlkP superfamily phosphohydrolase/phosphomutase
MRTPTRVLVLAGDALDDLLVAGGPRTACCRRFRRLMAEGSLGDHAQPVGLYVGALWPSFATGRVAGASRSLLPSSDQPRQYDAKLFLAQDLRAELFWTALSRAGRRVAVVDVPKRR